jgi:hypothetical protein
MIGDTLVRFATDMNGGETIEGEVEIHTSDDTWI